MSEEIKNVLNPEYKVDLQTAIKWKLTSGMCAHDGYLTGLLLTIVDAISSTESQKKALKDLIRNAINQASDIRHEWLKQFTEGVGSFVGDNNQTAFEARMVAQSTIFQIPPILDEVSYKYTRSE